MYALKTFLDEFRGKPAKILMSNEINLEKEKFFIRQIHLIPICNIQIIMQYLLCYQNVAAKLYTRRDARYWI